MTTLLVAVLAGPAMEGTLVTDWPIIPDDWPEGSQRDAEMAAFVCERLALDHVDWCRHVYAAQQLVKEPQFRLEVVEIAARLDETELLLQPELVAIHQSMSV